MPTLSDTPADLRWVRERVGDDPDDDTLDALFDEDAMGTRGAVALSVLRTRRANMISNPAQFNLTGIYSEAYIAAQLKAIDNAIADVLSEVGTDGDDATTDDGGVLGSIERADYCARR